MKVSIFENPGSIEPSQTFDVQRIYVYIDGKDYRLKEVDGILSISVDDSLLIRPQASNVVDIKSTDFNTMRKLIE